MKRVLFVDDDSAVLDGLRVRLHGLRKRWELIFVESGARAITEIELRPFDAIVTDMRMPGMDGAQLLEIVAQRWPETIRIVLSGYAEDEQTVRLLPVAHQYLSKPCDPQLLENVIARCLALHELLTEPRLRSIVGRIRQLPALPRTYSRLRDAMSKPDVGTAEVARIIMADTAIAAKVLQVVNSAFFRRARAITKIETAVSHLGFVGIRNIALSVEVFSQSSGNSLLPGFDPERLQQQGQRVAAIAHALAARTPLADDAMLAGLLHNIGYWVMVKECPKDLQQAREFAREHNIAMHEAEREILGASYAEVGAYLLGIWGLPRAVVEAVAFQHRSEQVVQTHFDVLSALVVARSLASAAGPDAFGIPQPPLRMIDDTYLGPLNAPFDWLEARRRAEAVMGEEQP
jgi:HD-like signal output (HDOD) protein